MHAYNNGQMAPSDETTAQRQERLLAAEDGRQYAIDKLNTGLAAIATTERVGTAIVSFNLPSAPALFLGLAHKAFATYKDIEIPTLFDRHPQGMWPDDHKPLLDLCEQFAAPWFLHSPPSNRSLTRLSPTR